MISIDLAEEVRRIVFAFDAGDCRRDAVRTLADKIVALEAERDSARASLATETKNANTYAHARDEAVRQRDAYKTLYELERAANLELRKNCPATTLDAYRRVLSVLCDALDKGGISSGSLAETLGATIGDLHSFGLQAVANAITAATDCEKAESDLESVAAELRRELEYKSRVRAALGSVDDPRETLDMARDMRAAIDRAHADLCTAYRHWDADRDSKVGKIIGDTARALKAAIQTEETK